VKFTPNLKNKLSELTPLGHQITRTVAIFLAISSIIYIGVKYHYLVLIGGNSH